MEVLALIVIIGLAFFVQTYIFEKYAFSKLEYTCEFSKSTAFEGDHISLIETVHNNKLLPLQWLKVEIYSSRWLEFAQTRSVIAQESRFVTSGYFLRSYQKTIRTWKVTCLKRGIYPIESVSLVAGDLFGHSTKSVPVPIHTQLMVYPKTINLQQLFIHSNYSLGDHIVKRWMMDDPFMTSGTREYTSRDPMNRIHWSSTAKHGTLMVRNNEYTHNRNLNVILNIQSMQYEYSVVINKGIIELGIKVAATIFDKALQTGTPIRFISNGSVIDSDQQTVFTKMAYGHAHTEQLLSILAKLQLRNEIDFEDHLENLIQHLDSSNMMIISAYLTSKLCRILSRRRSKNCPIEVLLLNNHIEPDIDVTGMNIHLLTSNIEKILSNNSFVWS